MPLVWGPRVQRMSGRSRLILNHLVQCCTRRPPAQARASVRSLDSTFTPSHRGGSGPPLVCLHGFTDTWRTWELVLPALERHHDVLAPTLLRPRRRAGDRGRDQRGRAGRRGRARRWTRPASRPRTSSATRSAATSRCSSRRAAGRGRSWRSPRPAAGRRSDESFKDTLAYFDDDAGAAQGRRAARGGDRRPRRQAGAARPQFIASHFEHIPPELLAHLMRGAASCAAAAPLTEYALRARLAPRRGERQLPCAGRLGHGRQDPAVAVGRRALPHRLAAARRLGRARRRRPLPPARRPARDRAADPRLHVALRRASYSSRSPSKVCSIDWKLSVHDSVASGPSPDVL